jgi:bifunctional non-homologous end joining protein LigD
MRLLRLSIHAALSSPSSLSGPGWAHELKHDGYRLQIRVRDRRVRLYTMNGADWSKRYPQILRTASRIQGAAIIDGEDLRSKPYVERKAALRKLLQHGRGIQYVEHAEGHGDRLFAAACKLGLEGIVSKKLDAPYRSGPSKTWIKVKNPKSPAVIRAVDGTF